jgi:hypothetical protein
VLLLLLLLLLKLLKLDMPLLPAIPTSRAHQSIHGMHARADSTSNLYIQAKLCQSERCSAAKRPAFPLAQLSGPARSSVGSGGIHLITCLA